MFDQMQEQGIIVSEPLVTSSLPDHVHFGHTTVTNDHEEFLEAIGYGIESYCELHLDQTQMSARHLLQELRELATQEDNLFTEKPFSDAVRLGFLFGRIAGLLHPDVADMWYDQLTYLEALSWKCKAFHQSDCQDDREPGEVYYIVRPS